ncbi:MAG: HAMP domain-containing sensor histidine kinase [Candidatus Falkowbacteria bacterium]
MINFIFKLSDKILLTVFLFATGLILSVVFFIGGLPEQILILGELIYIFVFLVTFTISRTLTKRLRSLTFEVEEMAAGNLSKRLPVKNKDEIGQLTSALNELLVRLQTGVAQDVTKHREIAQAKTDFVAIASHQLRTPLSIVKWYVDYVVSGDAGELNPEQAKYLREVYRNNERLIDLVNALLDVSRIDLGTFSIEPEPTDLIGRAEGALKKFLPEIESKKINLEKEYDSLPEINLDPRLTKIVFENILSNAVKYTPEKGTIRVTIKKTEHQALIKISDTGCGIPRSEQPKIFTKLFRAENAKKMESSGTGLGLYIAKAVIEKSGGKIWFQSPSLELLLNKPNPSRPIDQENKGTTFFITIPLRGMKKKVGIKKLMSVER